MNGWMLLLLLAQAALAIAALSLFKSSVLPALGSPGRRELFVDVWGPIALFAPFLVAAIGIDLTMSGPGWIVVGGPVCVGAFVAGSALLVGPLPAVLALPRRLKLTLAGAGLVVILLSAAHDLTIWSGQIIFALGAVVLWMNSPETPAGRGLTGGDAPASARLSPTLGLTLMVVCAILQGVCVLSAGAVSPTGGPLPGLLLIGYGFGAGILAAGTPGAPAAVRLGGWTAGLGCLLAIGTMSVAHLLPQAAAIVSGRNIEVRTHVAHSFGVFVLDGVLLAAMAASFWLASVFLGVGRRVLGFVLIALAAALVAARLSDLWSTAGPAGGS